MLKSLIRYLFFILFFFFLQLRQSLAQGELNCNVTIDASQTDQNSQNKALIEEVKTAITNFMNTRRWTTDTYSPEERIRCNLSITITDISGVGNFVATAQVQSSRPVYGGSYEIIWLRGV